jgi:prevent-host-death family protein
MEATILDLRRRTREVLEALERNEAITITYRGKKKGVITPIGAGSGNGCAAADHPAFGIWRDREDGVAETVREIRKGRVDAR